MSCYYIYLSGDASNRYKRRVTKSTEEAQGSRCEVSEPRCDFFVLLGERGDLRFRI